MKTLTKLFLTVAVSSFFLTSCHKICVERDVVTKKNLPLSGLQEVPQRETPGKGKMDVSYNKRTKELSFKVTWTNLTGNPVGSHIHGEAPRGVNAGVKFDFTAPLPKVTSGSYSGVAMVDEVAIKEAGLLSGLYYINIHTPKFPGGEIRGQIEF